MKKHNTAESVRVLIVAIMLLQSSSLYGAESNKASSVTISVQQAFSIEFYTDANVLYSDAVPFTNVDPSASVVYPDGRREFDGKSDTAVICRSNAGSVWFFKVHVTPTAPLTADKLKYYVDQPYNRNTGGRADGTLAQSANWYPLSSTPTTIYSAGFQDQSNLPFGTLITFNFSLNPNGLEAGRAYSAAITYTLTTTA